MPLNHFYNHCLIKWSKQIRQVDKSVYRYTLISPWTEQRNIPTSLVNMYHLFSHESQRSFTACYLYMINNIVISGGQWLSEENGKTLDKYRPSVYSYQNNSSDNICSQHSSPFFYDSAVWLHDEWSTNYFHWLCDVLPKIYLMQCYFLGKLPIMLISSALAKLPYVTESLQLLGVNWKEYEIPHITHIKKLYTIPTIAPSGNYNSKLIQLLSYKLRQLSNCCANPEVDKYFIRRLPCQRRAIINDQEVVSAVSKYGFRVINLDTVSFRQQISLFTNTCSLVGVHGAGLANMLFMRPGNNIFEIRRKNDSLNNCYYSLSSSLKHHYYFMEANETIDDTRNSLEAVSVDISVLTRILDIMASSNK